jgi:phage gpG-like protein
MVKLTVTFPAPDDNVLTEMARLSSEIPKAIKRGLDRGAQLMIALMREDFFSGTGPYPVSEHRLGERSGQLSDSIRATPAVIRGTEVTIAIGSGVRYAGVHEYGMTIYPKTKPFLAFQIDGEWKRAKKVTIPAREPFRYGIAAHSDVMSSEIMDEVNEAVDKLL